MNVKTTFRYVGGTRHRRLECPEHCRRWWRHWRRDGSRRCWRKRWSAKNKTRPPSLRLSIRNGTFEKVMNGSFQSCFYLLVYIQRYADCCPQCLEGLCSWENHSLKYQNQWLNPNSTLYAAFPCFLLLKFQNNEQLLVCVGFRANTKLTSGYQAHLFGDFAWFVDSRVNSRICLLPIHDIYN